MAKKSFKYNVTINATFVSDEEITGLKGVAKTLKASTPDTLAEDAGITANVKKVTVEIVAAT